MRFGFGFGFGERRRPGISYAPPNQRLLAAVPKDGSALLAVLGGSRDRQNAVGVGGNIVALASGQYVAAQAMGRRFRMPFYYSDAADENSNDMSGFLFAADGEGAWRSWPRIPAVLASDAQVVIVPMSSNSVQYNDFDIRGTDLGTSFSAANYCGLYQQIAQALIDGGKAVILVDLIPRAVYLQDGVTPIGGVWSSGSAPRQQLPIIAASMRSWAAANGIPYLPLADDFTTVQVNGGNTDVIPIPDYVRSDNTHWSPRGAWVYGAALDALLSGLGWTAHGYTPDPGSTLTPVHSGDATVTVTEEDGWTVTTIDTSTMAAGVQEGLSFDVDLPGLASVEAGKYYAATIEYDLTATGTVYGPTNLRFSAGASSHACAPIGNGGSPIYDLTDQVILPGPAPAAGVLETPPQVVSSTAATLTVMAPAFRADSGTITLRLRGAVLHEVADPHALMYDEADNTPPVLTSAAALSTPEGTSFSAALHASKPVRWALAGDDAALFAIDTWGTLTMLDVPDYEAPADANGDNVYDLVISMQDRNPAGGTVSQPITVSVTDVADGYTDLGAYAAGTALEVNPAYTHSGSTAGALQYTGSSGGIKCASTNAATSYLAPQQGDSVDQALIFRPGITSHSAGAACPLMLDAANWIGITAWTSTTITVSRKIAGMQAVQASFTLYKAAAMADEFIVQIRDGELEVYQNKVRLPVASGSADVSAYVTAGGALSGARCGGLASRNQTNNGWIRFPNWREAFDVNARLALGDLALTDQMLVAGEAYAGVISGYTGAPNMAVTADASGLFFVDGYNLRTTAPLVTGQVYTVTVSETNAAAVNSPRANTFTVTVP